MDAVEKRAAGETLSVRDEQRLRNHQLRMMRRQWLNDLIVSPREPLYPNNNVHELGTRGTIMFRRAHIMWNALGAKALVPANRNWHFQPIVMNEFFYGNLAKVPTLIAWRFWKAIGYTFLLVPIIGAIEIAREEYAMRRWPTLGGLFPQFGAQPAWRAAAVKVFPGDETFTTRLRNVEWGHDAVIKMDQTPRMKPDAVTYPIGTRMNWVTWEPILPEDNFLETPDYGNGPGGVGHMTETYRLIHLTKARGLYSKDNPDEPTLPFSSITKNFWRPITGDPGPINDPNHPANKL